MLKMKKVRSILVTLMCLFSVVTFPKISCAKFIQTHLTRVGGAALSSGDEAIMAKYDLIAVNRFHYNDINGDTWRVVKAINPNVEIYLYQLGRESEHDDDIKSLVSLNNLGRWDISRGHSMGSLNGDNTDLYLLNSSSNRIYNSAYTNAWVHDIGDTDYQNYWIEATINDIADQTWAADGIIVDVCTVKRTNMSSMPVKYSTDTAWSTAMNSFINAITVGLNAEGQKIACNRVGTRDSFIYDQWVTLDNTAHPPDAVHDEGAFVVKWGTGDAFFFGERDWKRQVDILGAIHNSKVCMKTHSDMAIGGSGVDQNGVSVTFWDAFWYAMGSYLLGKNEVDDNSYWEWSMGNNYVLWFDEFDQIDLGKAIGKYKITNNSGNNIYWREFEKGYVYVNPTQNNVSSISLPETCKQLSHSNFKSNPDTLPNINIISIKGRRAVFLLKKDVSASQLSPPSGLQIRTD